MKTLHKETTSLLQSLGYRRFDAVWSIYNAKFGFVIGRSYLNEENDEKLHLMVYHEAFAESGHYLETTELAIAEQFIRNIHFLNQCEKPRKKS